MPKSKLFDSIALSSERIKQWARYFRGAGEEPLSKKEHLPPLPPDPRITPMTSKGNYPSKGVDYFVDGDKITFVRPLEDGEGYGNEIPKPDTEDTE